MKLQLRIALVEILDQETAVSPRRVRFFRGQMQTIISRALADLDITPVPSRRCFTLIRESQCPQHPAHNRQRSLNTTTDGKMLCDITSQIFLCLDMPGFREYP